MKLHEAFHCAKKVYLVQECMTGGELFDRIVEKEKSVVCSSINIVAMKTTLFGCERSSQHGVISDARGTRVHARATIDRVVRRWRHGLRPFAGRDLISHHCIPTHRYDENMGRREVKAIGEALARRLTNRRTCDY